LQLAM